MGTLWGLGKVGVGVAPPAGLLKSSAPDLGGNTPGDYACAVSGSGGFSHRVSYHTSLCIILGDFLSMQFASIAAALCQGTCFSKMEAHCKEGKGAGRASFSVWHAPFEVEKKLTTFCPQRCAFKHAHLSLSHLAVGSGGQ